MIRLQPHRLCLSNLHQLRSVIELAGARSIYTNSEGSLFLQASKNKKEKDESNLKLWMNMKVYSREITKLWGSEYNKFRRSN